MKKTLIVFLTLLLLCFSSCGGAKGVNVVDIDTTDNMVLFKAKCPKCEHISLLKTANVCKGEHYKDFYQCENCLEGFEISIDR